MKPQQQTQLAYLSRCSMDPIAKWFVDTWKQLQRWDEESKTITMMNPNDAATLRYLWNRYKMQIRHLMKAERKQTPDCEEE